MIWARDFGSDERMEIPEYFVYFGIFIQHSWSKRSGQIAKEAFLEVLIYYSWGPAATRALPSSLPVYLVKFLMKRADRSFAFSSQMEASA